MTRDEAEGRATGSLFFTGFGSVWLCLGLAGTHRASTAAYATAVGLCALLVALTFRIFSLAREVPAATPDAEREERAKRMFAAVNIIQWVSVATAVGIFAVLRLPEYIAPSIAMIVGLHLFPLAGAFRYPPHKVTGLLLVLWPAGVMAWLPRASIPGAASVGTGVILLASAAYALLGTLRLISAQRASAQRAGIR